MVPQPLCCVTGDSVITRADFSTGSVKFPAFDLDGHVLADVRLPTDLWIANGVSELNLMQLEGQVHVSIRELAAQLRETLGPNCNATKLRFSPPMSPESWSVGKRQRKKGVVKC